MNKDLADSGAAFRFAVIQQEIAEAMKARNSSHAPVTLVAVTKTHPQEAVREALLLGHRCFAENKVQEARDKYPDLQREFPDLELHLIGPLQTNKIGDAVKLFDVIETVDRLKLAEALAKSLEKEAVRTTKCLIQVNTGEEPQKAGILPSEADAFIRDCRERLALPIAGLMAIPPVNEEPALHFALLREIARRHELATLSMGMSQDFKLAIQQGATQVRIGTALFGPRPRDQIQGS